MMDDKKTGRIRLIGLRLTSDEYEILDRNWKNTTVRKLSEYVRRLLFGKPVTTYHRNKSLDELVSELVLLRKELNAIGVNFNQAVHRLHTLDYLPQMQLWLEDFERNKSVFLSKIEAIKMRMDAISDTWLQ